MKTLIALILLVSLTACNGTPPVYDVTGEQLSGPVMVVLENGEQYVFNAEELGMAMRGNCGAYTFIDLLTGKNVYISRLKWGKAKFANAE